MSQVSERTLAKVLGDADKARRLVLSLFFRAALGIERIFHFETIEDMGFAILTGGRRVLSRSRLGGLVRAVTTRAVQSFSRATERFGKLRGHAVTLSLDEHAIARFTRKFRIAKGFHTIRNKKMRIEKLFFLHWPASRCFLHLVVTRGNAALDALVGGMIRAVRARVRPRQVRMLLDAGAAKKHAALRDFDRYRKTVFLIRVPRRPAYVAAWKRLPKEAFTRIEEPGRYVGAKPKAIEIAETTISIRDIARPVRTLVVRERAMRGKDRWHALFILHDEATPALELLHEFRSRQHHEQGYRIGVHDLALDTVPSGYPKTGRPDRPGFRRGPLTLCAWLAACAWDALRELGLALPKRFHLAHPRTLRRWVLVRDAELLVTSSPLLVVLEAMRRRALLRPLIRQFNAVQLSLPWLDGRRIAMGFAAGSQRLPDARPVLPDMPEIGSDCARRCRGVRC
ncbi:hypothetical protein ACMHYB_17330 [Sorangium sp. So ce1128]